MDKLQNFHYAMYLANSMYGITMLPEDFEEIGLIAYNLIGNKKARLYRAELDIDKKTNTVTLPCNCDRLEAVTYQFEDWNYVTNQDPEGDYASLFTEAYIESRKGYRNPLYLSGKFAKFERVGDTLYLDQYYNGKIWILYFGEILDDEGLPQLTDKEAIAIATYCAYVTKYKEGIQTNNGNIIQMATVLKADWNRQCDAARVVDYFTQNDMDNILDAKTSWNRKIYGKSYKAIQ